MNEKIIRTVESKIKTRKDKIDKSNNPYLILELESGETVFVFPSIISEYKWFDLDEGEEYIFSFEEGEKSNRLISYEQHDIQ